MRIDDQAPVPRARTEGLLVKAVPDEVLVYDLARHRAHSLNATAAAVWRACDGVKSRVAILAHVAAVSGQALDAAAVDYALAQLRRAHLLDDGASGAGWVIEAGPRLARRDLLRRGTIAAAIPLVASIVAPIAAQAQSCIPDGGACQTVTQCCCNGQPGCICAGAGGCGIDL